MDVGTALSVVSLSFQLFAGCVRGFVLLSDARDMTKDAAVERTRLVLQEYRLIEWARAIGLDSSDSDRRAGLDKFPAAQVLVQLEQILSSTDLLKNRYKLELLTPPDGAGGLVLSDDNIVPGGSASSILSTIVSSETRRGILERATKLGMANPMAKRLWWAVVDKKKYARLVSDVTSLVDGLWSFLDISHRMQTSRAVNKTLQLAIQTSHDIKGLQNLHASLVDSTPAAAPDFDMSNGLAASAGIKAQRMNVASRSNPEHVGHQAVSHKGGEGVAPALVLNPSQLTAVHMVSSYMGSALYRGNSVLIEEKHVSAKLKPKLRARVEALVHLLFQPPTPSFQTFSCLGYTEEQSGFRLVFRFPSGAGEPISLHKLLSRSSGTLPSVGTRLRLATQLCQTLLSFHTAGWLHKDVRSDNVVLVSDPLHDQAADPLGRPYLSGFSFARQDSPTEISEHPTADPERDIYRHAKALGEPSESFERYMDAYSLGCVLIEIADWAPLAKIVKRRVDVSGGAGVKLTQVAALPSWLHDRYISDGIAAFRLGAAFSNMLALCIPAADKIPDLVEFYSALQDLVCCNI